MCLSVLFQAHCLADANCILLRESAPMLLRLAGTAAVTSTYIGISVFTPGMHYSPLPCTT